MTDRSLQALQKTDTLGHRLTDCEEGTQDVEVDKEADSHNAPNDPRSHTV